MTNRVKRLITATDLGPGDGGKGGVVHKLCDEFNAHTVIKVGGAQGSHGVCTSRGERFAFSQFGCGTFDGARTHITSRFVVDPNGLLNEGLALQNEWRIADVFEQMTVDQDALCVTPFHQIASRLRELARKNNPRGTIGTGVGEAFLDRELHPDLAIHVRDATRHNLRDLFEAVRAQKRSDIAPLLADGVNEVDRELANELLMHLEDPTLSDWAIERFALMAAQVRIVDHEYMGKEILSRDGVVVVESSHGVLTDRYYGFHPHTSRIRTLPRFTHELVRDAGYDGGVINLGVTRAYQIRHGAGPMVTDDPSMLETLLPGSHKPDNRYQGQVRVGPLDFVALRYAIDVCGGPAMFSGLAITWFDQIQMNGRWNVCSRYKNADDLNFFKWSGSNIRVTRGGDGAQLSRQQALGHALSRCEPVLETYEIPDSSDRGAWCRLVEQVIPEELSVPVKMISFGPTEKDKVLL